MMTTMGERKREEGTGSWGSKACFTTWLYAFMAHKRMHPRYLQEKLGRTN